MLSRPLMGKQGKERCTLHILALVHILFTGDLLHHFYFAINISQPAQKDMVADVSFNNNDKEINSIIQQSEDINNLKRQYGVAVAKHAENEERIGVMYAIARELKLPDSPEMEAVITLCKEDILLAPDVIAYQKEWDRIMNTPVNQRSCWYGTFKRLAIIYEKQGRYKDALDVCRQSVELGVLKDGTEGGMIGRAARLQRKINNQAKRIDSISE